LRRHHCGRLRAADGRVTGSTRPVPIAASGRSTPPRSSRGGVTALPGRSPLRLPRALQHRVVGVRVTGSTRPVAIAAGCSRWRAPGPACVTGSTRPVPIAAAAAASSPAWAGWCHRLYQAGPHCGLQLWVKHGDEWTCVTGSTRPVPIAASVRPGPAVPRRSRVTGSTRPVPIAARWAPMSCTRRSWCHRLYQAGPHCGQTGGVTTARKKGCHRLYQAGPHCGGMMGDVA
jgi:hypothetical protein